MRVEIRGLDGLSIQMNDEYDVTIIHNDDVIVGNEGTYDVMYDTVSVV